MLRQTFVLQDSQGTFLQPTSSYDPVSRVVRLCVAQGEPLQADHTYTLTIATPGDASDPNGLRAIDGALLDPSQGPIGFQVVGGAPYAGADACPQPSPARRAAGRRLLQRRLSDLRQQVRRRAVPRRCAAGGGPPPDVDRGHPRDGDRPRRAGVEHRRALGDAAVDLLFGVDMPIVSSAGSPGESWLMYKLLLAIPPTCSSTPAADAGGVPPPCTATAPGPTKQALAVPWSLMADSERATLSDWIPGREMPFPSNPNADPGTALEPLTADELETVSLWILQGAAVPDCPP